MFVLKVAAGGVWLDGVEAGDDLMFHKQVINILARRTSKSVVDGVLISAINKRK